ncbi:DUF2794 domain-containing protein [Candidatus Pelagibacter sp.]|nr:DUF2794 domain-containing protein [Candidatus Pelagibacter sp.]
MNNNLRLVINNVNDKKLETKHFFEKDELKIILDLYAKMVSEGSWKDYGLNISSKQVGFSIFKNAAENALYKICKNFKPKNKNLKYLITDTNGKIIKNSYDLSSLLKNINWKKLG